MAPSGDSAIFRRVEQNGRREAGALREHLLRAEKMREQIAKAWLVDVILDSPLAEVERMPIGWATGELPELVCDILAAVAATDADPFLSPEARERAARLAELRRESPPAQLTREISSLHPRCSPPSPRSRGGPAALRRGRRAARRGLQPGRRLPPSTR